MYTHFTVKIKSSVLFCSVLFCSVQREYWLEYVEVDQKWGREREGGDEAGRNA